LAVPNTDWQQFTLYFFFAAGFFAFGAAFLAAAVFVAFFAGMIYPPYNVII
jgi:hypothetical protein